MQQHLPFQKNRNFCGINQYNHQPLAVIGAPIDCATTFRSGTRMGPAAIRDASLMLTDGNHETFYNDLIDWVGDAGDMALPTGNTLKMLAEVEKNAKIFNDKHLVTLGGDHGITLGLLRALKKEDPISVVHFDAHCDAWSDHFGEKYGHGTWVFNAIEEKLVNPNHMISIGIRSPADDTARTHLARNGGTTISARQAMKYPPQMMADIIRAKVGNNSTYLSLDIDCLDPAYAPGTGTPEIGGLTTVWLQETIDLLSDINWVGMDVVEVSPPYDHSNITALAAATFAWQYLSMVIHTTYNGK